MYLCTMLLEMTSMASDDISCSLLCCSCCSIPEPPFPLIPYPILIAPPPQFPEPVLYYVWFGSLPVPARASLYAFLAAPRHCPPREPYFWGWGLMAMQHGLQPHPRDVPRPFFVNSSRRPHLQDVLVAICISDGPVLSWLHPGERGVPISLSGHIGISH